jgi:tetratricopeptide (TPR) repeat protein
VVQEALVREPANEAALLQKAILDRRRGEVAQAESALSTLAADTAHTWQTRAQASYELAQLLDALECYDNAYDAILAAKRLVKPHAAAALNKNQDTLMRNQQLIEQLDKSRFDRWRALAESDSAYRIGILTSHPRSGTTLVEQILDSHDDLTSADEFDVFTQWVYLPIVRRFPSSTPILSVLDSVPAAVRAKARAKYWEQTEAIFDEPIGQRLLLEKNPGMIILLPVIYWAFPEMKMLIALRDPRDVVLSCFMQKVQLTPISSNWLTLAGTAEYYARAMRTWLTMRTVLPPSPHGAGTERGGSGGDWLEFRYEDVVADLEREARRILEFLGLPWDEKVLKFYEHAREKMVRSPTYKEVTQPVYHKSVGRWQHYAPHFEPILEKFEPFIKEFGYATD